MCVYVCVCDTALPQVLQRLHRNKHLRVAVMRERLLERRAVRLRVHEIIVYEESDRDSSSSGMHLQYADDYEDDYDYEHEDKEKEHRQLDLEEKYFVKLDTNAFPTTDMQYVSNIPLDMRALNGHMLDAWVKNIPELKKNLLTNMMLASSGGVDPAATLHDVDRGTFPPKSFFLTVTVHKSENDMKQIYRVDVPLKEAHDLLLNESAGMAEKMQLIEQVHTMFEGNPSLYEHVTKIRLYPPKPYLVFPACSPGVVITMTLSRVTEWPRAQYICDHSYVADHALTWRQVTCVSHGMSPNEIPPLPSAMRRLQMYVAKRHNTKVSKMERDKIRQAKLMKKVNKQMHMISHTSEASLESSGEQDSDGDADSVVSTESVESLSSVSSVSSSLSRASVTSFPSIDKKKAVTHAAQSQSRSPDHNRSPGHSHSHSPGKTSCSHGHTSKGQGQGRRHSSYARHGSHGSRHRKVVSSARVLWTLMPTPNAGVVVGYLNFYAHGSPAASSIKYWCVVIDKCLLVYKNRGDTKPPRESVNLRVCTCTITSKEMIHIYRPSDKQTWFCMGSGQRRHDWVAWIMTACDSSSSSSSSSSGSSSISISRSKSNSNSKA